MRKRILLLEDDFDTNEIITLMFEPEGFQVITTSITALKFDIEHSQPHLIIADHWLNQIITGSDICKQLKADPATCQIPFIITSAVNNLKAIALDCCADAYIEKPFSIDNFVSVVRRLLRSKAQLD